MLVVQSLKCAKMLSTVTALQIASVTDSNVIFCKYVMEINYTQINANAQSVHMCSVWSFLVSFGDRTAGPFYYGLWY